ncbi:MAG: IS200/IS605 family transposase, partial [Bacteroides ovatus]
MVFAPKYRRQVFYREKRRAIGCILRKLCEWKSGKRAARTVLTGMCYSVGSA